MMLNCRLLIKTIKSEHAQVGTLKRVGNMWLWNQADDATSTGLPIDILNKDCIQRAH